MTQTQKILIQTTQHGLLVSPSEDILQSFIHWIIQAEQQPVYLIMYISSRRALTDALVSVLAELYWSRERKAK